MTGLGFLTQLPVKKVLIIAFLVIIIVSMVVSGSTMPDEIKPGDGSSQASKEVKIPPSDNWIDSGISIGKDTQELQFTVNGSVFLCADAFDGRESTRFKKRQVLVQASNNKYEETLDHDEEGFLIEGSQLKIFDKDVLTFNLIPHTEQIKACSGIPSNIILDKDNTFFDKNGNKLSQEQVCNGGDIYGKDKKLISTNKSFANKDYIRIISNSNDAKSNRWIRTNKSTGLIDSNSIQWFDGSFADLRLDKFNDVQGSQGNETMSEKLPIDKFDCKSNPPKAPYNVFESPIVNEHCKTYARQSSGGNVFASYQDNTTIDKDSPNIAIAFAALAKNSIAEGLVASIHTPVGEFIVMGDVDLATSTTNDPDWFNKINFTDTESIKKHSLRLNYNYKIKNLESYGESGNLTLSIADLSPRANNIGGYNVEVVQTCVRSNGDDLYLFLGDEVPNGLKPGDPKTIHIGPNLKNGIYTLNNTASESAKLYFMVKDNHNDKADGFYSLGFTITQSPTFVSKFIAMIVDPVKRIIYNKDKGGVGVSYDFYHVLINSGIKNIIRALLILFITIVALGFTFGIITIKLNDLFIIFIKFGIISILLTDRSWDFLHKNFLNLFWEGPDVLIAKFTGFYQFDKFDASFGFLDKTLGTIFSWQNIIRYLSLFAGGFKNPMMWFIFVITTLCIIEIIQASLKGVLLYVSCIIINGFLIGLTPIFFCFLLFKFTFRFFESWMKQLIINMTTVVFYFIAVGMLNEILYYFIYQVFNYGVYKECMFNLSIGSLKACIVYFPIPFSSSVAGLSVSAGGGGSSSADIISSILPVKIPLLIIFYIFSKCYHIVIDITGSLSTSLFGGSPVFSAMSVADSASQGLVYTVGQDRASIGRREKAASKLKKEEKQVRLRGGLNNATSSNIEGASDINKAPNNTANQKNVKDEVGRLPVELDKEESSKVDTPKTSRSEIQPDNKKTLDDDLNKIEGEVLNPYKSNNQDEYNKQKADMDTSKGGSKATARTGVPTDKDGGSNND